MTSSFEAELTQIEKRKINCLITLRWRVLACKLILKDILYELDLKTNGKAKT